MSAVDVTKDLWQIQNVVGFVSIIKWHITTAKHNYHITWITSAKCALKSAKKLALFFISLTLQYQINCNV